MENYRFIPPHTLKTPVLFLIYKRLDTAKQVFEAIRKAKPPKLYIAGDGPKANVKGEAEKVTAVREWVMNNIDWDCEVKTLFREKNLGCKYAVSSAITWFFEHEEMGIILEDDTVPSLSFFWFCEELLERYKDDMRIGQICGVNVQNGIKRGDSDYYFSIFNHIWGWATWANRWEKYDVDLSSFNDINFIKDIFFDKNSINYWKNIFIKMKKQEIDTWDYQWTFTLWRERQLSVIPNKNLIKNIGFSENATHTKNKSDPNANLEINEIVLKKHPQKILRNLEADKFTSQKIFNYKPVWKRIVNKISRVFLKRNIL